MEQLLEDFREKLTADRKQQEKDAERQRTVFGRLNAFLLAQGLPGQVGHILCRDNFGKKVIVYRDAVKKAPTIRNEAIFQFLSMHIGRAGTNLMGQIRHEYGSAPRKLVSGFLVPISAFEARNADAFWIALQNIPMDGTKEAIPFRLAA